MIRRLSVALALSLLVTGLAFSAVSAEEGTMEPPPDTTVEQMMAEMPTMMDKDAMLAEILGWISQLPIGVSDLLAEPIHHLHHRPDDSLMMLHYELHHTNLLQQPPGQILLYIQSFGTHAGH